MSGQLPGRPGRGRVLGLDIGGSSSRAQVWDGDRLVAEAEGPSASIAAAGPEQAPIELDRLLAGLGAATRGVEAAAAGVAGYGINPTRELYTQRLGEITGEITRVRVMEDVHLLLPAAGLSEGVAVVAGTGSCAAGARNATRAKVGGWGYLLGDDGSGYWLVRQAARVVLARLEMAEGAGGLGEALFEALGVTEPGLLRDRLFQDPRPRVWAAAVPRLLAVTDDPAVAQLRSQAVAEWVRLVGRVRSLLGLPTAEATPVVLAGGLSGDKLLVEMFRTSVTEMFRGSSVVLSSAPPVQGAVALARAALT